MEVTQKIQPVQDVASLLFEDIEGRVAELEQEVTAFEQILEGPVTKAVIQEFVKKEALAKHHVEASRANLEAFEAKLPRVE
jgi:hypothetical protein